MRSSSEPACKASYQLLAVPIATPRRKETRQAHIPGLNQPPRATTAEAAQSSTRHFAAAKSSARLLLVMLAILARGAALQGALQACGS